MTIRVPRNVPRMMLLLSCLAAPPALTGAAAAGSGDAALAVTDTPYEEMSEGLDTDARQRLFWLDFGLSGRQPPGAWFYDGSARAQGFAWTGMVRIVRGDPAKGGPYLCDFVEGDDATFLVSTTATSPCRMVVTFGDPEQPRGPVRVEVPGLGSVGGITTRAGEYRNVGFEVTPVNGRLSVRFAGENCASFAIAGLAVYVMPGDKLSYDLFPQGSRLQPPEANPGGPAAREEVEPPTGRPVDTEGARDMLRQIAWYLVQSRPEEGCFSTRGAWYESAYSTRTLLAAGRLLDEPAFSDAAYDCLDRFQSEQLPDGNWAAHYFGKKGCELARLELKDPNSANLADVGTMVMALIAGSGGTDKDRQARYEASIRRYIDQVVLPNQLADGSFPNLRHAGTEHRNPYSVATAVQAMVLSAAGRMIGEQRYQAAADSAARFLVKGFRKAGKYNFHRHDHPTPSLIQGIRFGDMYYILEALLWVRRYTEDAALRSAIQTSLDQYFWIGGIAGYRVNEVLWRPADDWEASKLGALLYVLNDYKEGLRGNEDPTQARRYRDASTWAASYLDWLRVPQQSASLGIGVDVYGPGGAYAYPASGFAGIGVASAADPSSIYLP